MTIVAGGRGAHRRTDQRRHDHPDRDRPGEYQPGSLTNEAGAVYDIQNTSLPRGTLQNSGLFEKSTGTGTSQIGNEVDNTGTIEVDAGHSRSLATALRASTRSPRAILHGRYLDREQWGHDLAARRGPTSRPARPTSPSTARCTLQHPGPGIQYQPDVDRQRQLHHDRQLHNAGALTLGGNTLSVTGTYTQGTSDALNAQLGGVPSSGQFGQVAVTGSAMLAGTLQSELVDGYVPTAGDSFPIMTFASSTGSFASASILRFTTAATCSRSRPIPRTPPSRPRRRSPTSKSPASPPVLTRCGPVRT